MDVWVLTCTREFFYRVVLFIICRFLNMMSYQTTVSDVTGRLCFIFDVYVKSREIPENRYWPRSGTKIQSLFWCRNRCIPERKQKQEHGWENLKWYENSYGLVSFSSLKYLSILLCMLHKVSSSYSLKFLFLTPNMNQSERLPNIDPNFNVSFPATACSPTFHKNEQWS
jgi:hypothetical protein